ncbi:MAG: SEC-C metal-binding domain-containing protein [Desulfobacterales bacterium]
MRDSSNIKFDILSEAEFEPVLKLLQGGDPDIIAQHAGITEKQLFKMRDVLIAQAERERTKGVDMPVDRVGRNAPCPCGSGKKYKRCCLGKCEAAGHNNITAEANNRKAKEKEQDKLIKGIEKAFGLLGSQKYAEAIHFASSLIRQYPNEDRLHDILATGYLYAGDCQKAIEICRQRLDVAESEKSYFIKHRRYRDAEIDKPALSYYYPPITWLQKYWIALKAKDYQAMYPVWENKKIVMLVRKLQTANDPDLFPEMHAQGFELRKNALKGTLDKLKATGSENMFYLLPLACRYSWAGLFVPEIIFSYKTDMAVRSLIDISMFGFAYTSGASLHYLEKLGETAIPHIENAFSRDKAFDPIKTGIVSVLGNIRGTTAYKLLLRLLEHKSSHIVNWAGDALGKFNNIKALPAMVAANEKIGGEKMIDTAIQMLQDLQDRGQRD